MVVADGGGSRSGRGRGFEGGYDSGICLAGRDGEGSCGGGGGGYDLVDKGVLLDGVVVLLCFAQGDEVVLVVVSSLHLCGWNQS